MAKYCTKCGKKVEEKDIFCQYCGKQLVDEVVSDDGEVINPSKNNSLALAGFIVSLCSLFISLWGLTAIVGIILSSIGLGQIKKTNENGKGLAIAGIIIGAASIVINVFAVIIMLFLALWA